MKIMTFKEVDEKINHYEIELKKCVDEIAQTELFLENDNDEVKNLAKAHKLKVEFFCFVTTSYIDWLCVYRNLQRSKSEWENYYNIKIAYLIAYETINTYYKFKGEIYKTVKKDYEEFFHTFFYDLTSLQIIPQYILQNSFVFVIFNFNSRVETGFHLKFCNFA